MMRTPERNLELIERLTDDDLIDFATTCSNRGVALAAEMHLRRRYPSTVRLKRPRPDHCGVQGLLWQAPKVTDGREQ